MQCLAVGWLDGDGCRSQGGVCDLSAKALIQMLRPKPCKICNTPAETGRLGATIDIHQECPRCGEFKIPRIYINQMPVDEDFRAKLSGWVYEQNSLGATPTLTKAVFERVAARPLPTFAERAERLLVEAVRTQKKLGDLVNLGDERFIAATYSQSINDIDELLKLLTERDHMKLAIEENCEILPKGHIAADELRRRPTHSAKGFIAMWFDPCMEQAYENGFHPGILHAGYDPIRIDRTEHINKIDDEIIAHIRSSAFVVADFTGHRGGVYFEAGFALGLGLPVIWTCREDGMKELHFDIRQYNCLAWEEEKPEDLAKNLQNRIEAVLGKGPKTVS